MYPQEVLAKLNYNSYSSLIACPVENDLIPSTQVNKYLPYRSPSIPRKNRSQMPSYSQWSTSYLTSSEPRNASIARVRIGAESSRWCDGRGWYHVPIALILIVLAPLPPHPTIQQVCPFAVNSAWTMTCLLLVVLTVLLISVPLVAAWRRNKVFMDHG